MLRNSETRSTSQDHYIEGSKWDQPPMITSDLRSIIDLNPNIKEDTMKIKKEGRISGKSKP